MIIDQAQYEYEFNYRNIYIDEITNNFSFRRAVRKFVKDQEFEEEIVVMITNGFIDGVTGDAELKCKSSNLVPQENKVLIVSKECAVRVWVAILLNWYSFTERDQICKLTLKIVIDLKNG